MVNSRKLSRKYRTNRVLNPGPVVCESSTLSARPQRLPQLSKRPGSVWNCLWGNALKRSPGIIRKSRVSYPGPGFLSSATWPLLPKKHYYGLNLKILPNTGRKIADWLLRVFIQYGYFHVLDIGSFHAKSPKIRKISRVTISDFDENWLKCSSTYMMATCKKVLSSGDKFYFYSHIYTGGVFPISYSRCRI